MRPLVSLDDLAWDGPGPDPGVLIYGSGRRGRVLADLLRMVGPARARGFLDTSRAGTVDGLPVLALDGYRPAAGDRIVVASAFWPEIVPLLRARGIHDYFVQREDAAGVACFVDVTSRCNVKCRFCPYLNDPDRPTGPDWDLDRFRTFLERLPWVRTLFFCSAGGEALLNPALPDMCGLLQARGCRVGLYTNGMALGRFLEDPTLRQGVDEVRMSFVSCDPVVQERWMRGGSLEAVRTALDGLGRLARAGERVPSLSLMLVLMDENMARLQDIVLFAARNGFREVNCTYMRPGRDPFLLAHGLETAGGAAERLLWLRQRDEAVEAARWLGLALTFELKLQDLFEAWEGKGALRGGPQDPSRVPERPGPGPSVPGPPGPAGPAPAGQTLTRLCLQPWNYLYIMNNGDVGACCLAGTNRVGNVFRPGPAPFNNYAHHLLKLRLLRGDLKGACLACDSAPLGPVEELARMVQARLGGPEAAPEIRPEPGGVRP